MDAASGQETALLIRATELDARVVSFADTLAQASGHQVAYVVDERSRPEAPDDRQIIGLSRTRCAALGLYCPPGFAWSCGDYGYYLARQLMPQVRWFWLIEHDVRFSGATPSDFFTFFAAKPEVDLVASYLRKADESWYWTCSVNARGLVAQRCFFPVTRMSARAIDVVLTKRIRHSRNLFRRLLWPNDEAMVATTLVDAGLVCRDINSFGRSFYSPERFSYANVIDGDSVDWSAGPTRLNHPVLYGEQYSAKLQRLAQASSQPGPFGRRAQRWAARVNRLSAW
jgi:hypothetical protein